MTANTPKSRKAKGREFQQKIRDDIITLTGVDSNEVQSTAMGQSGCDIYLSGEARRLFPFGVECKNQERLPLWDALKQAEINAKKEGLTPLMVFKKNHTEPWACIPWDILVELVWIAYGEIKLDGPAMKARRSKE